MGLLDLSGPAAQHFCGILCVGDIAKFPCFCLWHPKKKAKKQKKKGKKNGNGEEKKTTPANLFQNVRVWACRQELSCLKDPNSTRKGRLCVSVSLTQRFTIHIQTLFKDLAAVRTNRPTFETFVSLHMSSMLASEQQMPNVLRTTVEKPATNQTKCNYFPHSSRTTHITVIPHTRPPDPKVPRNKQMEHNNSPDNKTQHTNIIQTAQFTPPDLTFSSLQETVRPPEF